MSPLRRRAGLTAAACFGAGLLPGCRSRTDGSDAHLNRMASAAQRIGCDVDLHAGIAELGAANLSQRWLARTRGAVAAEPTEVFFATNRAFDRDAARFAEHIDRQDPDRLLIGATLLGVESSTEAPRPIIAEPTLRGTDNFRGSRRDKDSGAGALRKFLELAAARGSQPMVFVHGVWSGFSSSLSRAAQIAQFYAGAQPAPTPLAPLVFCWPSADSGMTIRGYRAERLSAAASGAALARLMRALADEPPELRRSLCLLAHSTGVWVLQHAVQALRADGRGPLPEGLFRAAVMVAGDTALDAALRDDLLRPISRLAQAVTISVNPHDIVLSLLSQRLLGNGPRLGLQGAPIGATLPTGMVVVDYGQCLPRHDDPQADATPNAVATADLVIRHHQYYRTAPRVRDDLALALRGNLEAPLRRRYLPEEAARAPVRSDPFYFYAT